MTQWIAPESPLQLPVMRVSDADREQAAERLREHWLAGRLDSAELDERSTELWSARTDHELAYALRELPVPAPMQVPAPVEGSGSGSSTIASPILGAVGLALLLVSFGFLSMLVLPLSATAWGLGRSARRRPGGRGRDQATAGMVLGIVGTAVSMLFLTGCAVVLL